MSAEQELAGTVDGDDGSDYDGLALSGALDNRPLDFEAYRRDPLARLVLDRLRWRSW